MKTSIVPAQITSVEDKLVGRLTVHQVGLLSIPLLFGFGAFLILPPNFHLVTYKLITVLALVLIFGSLSVRMRDELVIFWVIAFVRYNLRPQYYVYNKNNNYLRAIEPVSHADANEPSNKLIAQRPVNRIKTSERVKVEAIMTDPSVRMRFKTNRGGKLSVHISEVRS